MKVFLSSTVEGLRDARLSLIARLEQACENRVALVSYERNKRGYPTITPEETCLAMVRDCNALILLLDQYYGTPSRTSPGISITHAELREALRLRLTVIPVVRTQTWHEYLVWRKNVGLSVNYAHVKEPRLFEMLDELFPICNCHTYDNLTGDEALKEIADALVAVISEQAAGTVQHVTLPTEEMAARPSALIDVSERVPLFENGQVLRADDLNTLSQVLVEIAASFGLRLAPAHNWSSGQTLTATHLNALLFDVVRVYNYIGRTPPVWSFGQFDSGKVLRASHLNEIVGALRCLLHPKE